MPSSILRPSAVGTYNFWTLGAGASKQAATDPGDPVSHDDDTTYITKGVDPGPDNQQSLTIDTGLPAAGVIRSVNSIAVYAQARSDAGAGTESYFLSLLRGGTAGAAGSDAPGLTYRELALAAYGRPGGGSWVAADIVAGNLQVMISLNNDSAVTFRVTSVWAVVDYIAQTTGFMAVLFGLGPLVALGLHEMPALAAELFRRTGTLLRPEEYAPAWRALRAHRRPVLFL